MRLLGGFFAGKETPYPSPHEKILIHNDSKTDAVSPQCSDGAAARHVRGAYQRAFLLAVGNTLRGAIADGSHRSPLFRQLVRREARCNKFARSQFAISVTAAKSFDDRIVMFGKSHQDPVAIIAKQG